MPSNIGIHEFTASAILRQVTALSQTASPSIIASAGDTIKTSISHTVLHDKRDDVLLPTQGYLLKSMQEYAGVGGDVKYFKATAETQYIKTFENFWPRTHFVYGARGGVLWSLEKGATTRITDRFHLGGPTDVRGFREYGIGPKDGSTFKLSTFTNGQMIPWAEKPLLRILLL
jgi:outer membrane protein insertion porin family